MQMKLLLTLRLERTFRAWLLRLQPTECINISELQPITLQPSTRRTKSHNYRNPKDYLEVATFNYHSHPKKIHPFLREFEYYHGLDIS